MNHNVPREPLDWRAALPYFILALLALSELILLSCSAAQLQKEQAVLVKLKADAQTVAVAGCQNLPAVEVALPLVLEYLPAGTSKETITTGLQLAGPQVDALCKKLLATRSAPSP